MSVWTMVVFKGSTKPYKLSAREHLRRRGSFWGSRSADRSMEDSRHIPNDRISHLFWPSQIKLGISGYLIGWRTGRTVCVSTLASLQWLVGSRPFCSLMYGMLPDIWSKPSSAPANSKGSEVNSRLAREYLSSFLDTCPVPTLPVTLLSDPWNPLPGLISHLIARRLNLGV